LLPLFPCYVFLKTHLDRWQPILATPGIHHVVGFGGHPSIIPSSEIEAVQRMVEGPFKTEPTRFWNAAIESDSKPVHCRDWKGYCSARKAYGSWSFRLRCCKDRWP
jgi:transcription antitermination factor NusG